MVAARQISRRGAASAAPKGAQATVIVAPHAQVLDPADAESDDIAAARRKARAAHNHMALARASNPRPELVRGKGRAPAWLIWQMATIAQGLRVRRGIAPKAAARAAIHASLDSMRAIYGDVKPQRPDIVYLQRVKKALQKLERGASNPFLAVSDAATRLAIQRAIDEAIDGAAAWLPK